jgi:Tfp pilus assembly PilM family ATPase
LRLRISEPDLLCLDWDERSLRVINAGYAKGMPFVRNAFTEAVPAGVDIRDPQSMGPFLKKTLAEHRIRTRRAIVDIPRQDAVLVMLSLPKGSTDELAAMIHMQVGREMPFARDQAVIDFAVAKMEDNSPTCEVWAAAVRNNLIDHLRQVLTAAGLRAERIGLRSYANLLAVQAAGALPTRTVMVDVGPSMTEINVIRDGRLVFSRAAQVSIPPGGVTAPPPPPVHHSSGEETIPFVDDHLARPRPMDVLLVEVSRTIEAYRATDPGARIDQIILAGSTGITSEVAASVQTRFGVLTQLFSPPAALQWDVSGADATPFSAAVGLALSGGGDTLRHFNFAHPKEPEAEHRERVKRVPMVAVAIGLFLTAGLVLAYMPIRSRGEQIDELQSKIDAANADKKLREELSKQLKDVSDWQTKNVVWLDTIHQIAKDIFTSNKDAFFTRLDFNESGQVKLDFLAVDDTVAGDMVENARKIRIPAPLDKKKTVPVWTARPGDVEDATDPKYPVKDEVFMTHNALAVKPPAKR